MRFLLLLGPSGVGKSALIAQLINIEPRFVYISPYTTRPLREGETNKKHVSPQEMSEMENRGEFLVVNELYGIRYATPRTPILQAFERGNFPVLDWPVDRLHVMRAAFPSQLHVVYVAPPSIKILQERISADGRDVDGQRINLALEELARYWQGDFDSVIDHRVVSESGCLPMMARNVLDVYKAHLC